MKLRRQRQVERQVDQYLDWISKAGMIYFECITSPFFEPERTKGGKSIHHSSVRNTIVSPLPNEPLHTGGGVGGSGISTFYLTRTCHLARTTCTHNFVKSLKNYRVITPQI